MEKTKKIKSIYWDNINRRRHLRVEFPFTIHIHTFEGPSYSAYTENSSAGGVKVTLEEELMPGSVVDLEIFTTLKVVTCKGKIAWVRKRESKYLESVIFFDMGIEYQDIEEKDRKMLKSLVEEALNGEDESR